MAVGGAAFRSPNGARPRRPEQEQGRVRPCAFGPAVRVRMAGVAMSCGWASEQILLVAMPRSDLPPGLTEDG